MAVYPTVVVPEKTLVIPEHVQYPSIRIEVPQGQIIHTDVVRLLVTVEDDRGTEKTRYEDKVIFTAYPKDVKLDVIGVAKLNFVEAIKAAESELIEPK
jgi:hypothetical protein